MLFKNSRFSMYKKLIEQMPITVSLDIHDNSTYVYAVDLGTGELLHDTCIPGHYKKVLRHLKRLGPPNKVLILYEAGPHAFAPYRFFNKHGFTTKVIAPISIPKRNRKQKTDREDAIDNLSHYVGANLSFVTVPDIELEQARDCLRYRTQTVWNIIREKQRIHSLIKRLGLVYTATKTSWTKAHYAWLRKIEVSICTRTLINAHLENISMLEQQCQTIEASLDRFFETHPEYCRFKDAYLHLRGIGRVHAMTFVLEAGDLNRFSHPNQIMKFVGVVPGKHQSGEKDPALHITKAGNKFLRTAFVGAAKSYRDNRFLYSKKQLEKMTPPEKEFLSKMQNRLTHKYRQLRARGKHANKARVAVAREMCGFLWEYATKVIPAIEEYSYQRAA
jgi:transposase